MKKNGSYTMYPMGTLFAETTDKPAEGGEILLTVTDSRGKELFEAVLATVKHIHPVHKNDDGKGEEGYMHEGEVAEISRGQFVGHISNYDPRWPIHYEAWVCDETGRNRIQFGDEPFNNPERW